MKKFGAYLKNLRASGKIAFTTEEAIKILGVSSNALRCAMYKLKKEKDIISPAQGLYVIVPPEYQTIGSIPAEELVPILMKHWGIPYYVCLLSAADYHGASHQKPQVFQVMIEKQIKPLELGQVKIEFIYKKSIKNLPTMTKTVNTGYLTLSTPEVTAMDLLLYPERCGGINHIATVLAELSEIISEKELLKLMQQSLSQAWIQRLGLILERIDTLNEPHKIKLIKRIENHLKHQSLTQILLVPSLPKNGLMVHPKWGLIANTTIESDL